jgi:hypothetical protein
VAGDDAARGQPCHAEPQRSISVRGVGDPSLRLRVTWTRVKGVTLAGSRMGVTLASQVVFVWNMRSRHVHWVQV